MLTRGQVARFWHEKRFFSFITNESTNLSLPVLLKPGTKQCSFHSLKMTRETNTLSLTLKSPKIPEIKTFFLSNVLTSCFEKTIV